MKRRLSLLFFVAFVCAAAAQPTVRQRGEYALVLDDPPAAAALGASKAPRAAAQDVQQEVRRLLSERDITVTGSVSTAINAIYVRAGAAQEAMLRSLPGVKRVAWVPAVKLHLNKAIELAKVPQAWSVVIGTPQNLGEGVKIGIIDTGIDQTHPAFQDPVLPRPPSVPTCTDTLRLAALRDNICSYTNNKVIVARTYVYENARGDGTGRQFAESSRPDDLSPRDRIGHGTAVAMIVGGRQVDTPAGVNITGVAPKAWLGNYKVEGSAGVSGDYIFWSTVSMALEDAYNDGMDIVTLSLGGAAFYEYDDSAATGECRAPSDWPPGVAYQCDIRAWEVNEYPRLSPRGMTVVVSAGNDGDLGWEPRAFSSINTPGTAPAAITVGATTNSQDWFQTVGLTAGDAPQNLRRIPAVFGTGPRPGSRTEPRPLRDVAAIGANGFACSALPAGSLNGAIALVQRGPADAPCSFFEKVSNAANAGARGVIIYMLDGQNNPFTLLGLEGTNIWAAMIGNNDGTALKSFVSSHADTPVVFDPTWRSRTETANWVAAWSSRGPSLGTLGIKPEVVAPGIVYTATQNYDPNSDMFDASRYTAVSGTSFSGPIVAGVAALVKSKNTNFTPADVKSAIVNTANPQQVRETNDQPAGVTAAGAGLVDAEAAVRSNVTLDPPTISFGAVGPGSTTINRTVTVNNRSGNQLTAELETADSRISISSPQSGTMNVSLTRPTTPGRYEGTILIRGGAVNPLRVPYVYYVGAGIPHNIYPLAGYDESGIVNERFTGLLAARVVDQYGVPVDTPDGTVAFRSISGGGSIDFSPSEGCGGDPGTDKYGIAAASCVRLGGLLGEQQWRMEVTHASPMLTQDFYFTARQWPSIRANEVMDAARLQPGRAVVPGSYVAIKGSDLSDITKKFDELTLPTPPYLPLSIGRVSVSFDVPGLSVPAPVHYVSPEQVNIQIPWEMEGQSTAWMKVSVGDFSTVLYNVPLSAAAPAVFEWPGEYAAAQDPLVTPVRDITPSNPARKGQVITVYVNGLGQVDNRPQTGQVTPVPSSPQGLSRARIKPSVTIGGRPATVDFAGLSPTAIALGQINVIVPADAPSGRQPIIINSNGTDSKTVYLPIE